MQICIGTLTTTTQKKGFKFKKVQIDELNFANSPKVQKSIGGETKEENFYFVRSLIDSPKWTFELLESVIPSPWCCQNELDLANPNRE